MFKDMLANDIDAVFLNSNEFADEVQINGVPMVVSVDAEKLKFYNQQQELDGNIGDIFYFVSAKAYAEKLGRRPQAGEAQMFNRFPCTVASVSDTNGMLSVVLSYRG